ncbi:Paired amphipathic helix protein Sin3-like 2 [Euphorbia peplus]|nr:Paired amphipathic helix protein Sin3-like 2 [Euphorbia peplus]
MKRIRDDVYPSSSQFKRPFTSSHAESYEQSHIPLSSGAAGGGAGFGGNGVGGGGGSSNGGVGAGTASQKLTTNDALSYLKEVKDMFLDHKDKYDRFLEVMKDFKAQRTDTSGVIARVKELFKGHNNLIFGFNTFLPKGYEITLDEDEGPTKKTVEFNQAINFVNKIKRRFNSDEHVYKSFLDILNMYRREEKDINDVYSEVASLFEDHQDLLDEFTRFLPDTSMVPLPQNAQYGRTSIQRYNERSSTTLPLRQMHLDKQRRRDRIVSHVERDLSVDRPELDDDKGMMKVHREHRRRAEKENRDRRTRDQDDREPEHDSNRDFSSQRFPDKRKSARRGEGFGVDSHISSYEDKDNLKNMYNQGLLFCEKVKEKLGSSDDYQAFLKCLNIYSNGIIKKNDLQNLVADLLGKYPDLMEEFNDFFERCENIDGFLAGVMNKKSPTTDGHASRSIKVEDKDKEHKRDLDKERCREKYLAKSIQELDLSNCQSCTPSYRLLPDDYPIASASQRSELGAQVLNDNWVSVTSGSEDYSFKHMRRNQYEESLFRCEDDRFELDMLLESVTSTSKRAEELLNTFNENKIGIPFNIEDHLTALNLRCIERLYGDHGLDVLDILRKNPTISLPVVSTRLKQKEEEWTRCRADFNKVWAEIYMRNHYKSLDHRSFYFKQQDSKNLSTRSLVSEIKELKEKQQKEDDVLIAFAAGNREPISPHLQYEFSDMSIHEDLYKLVQYSCEELFQKEQSNKIMRLWTTFLEPMLGIVSHTNVTESSKVERKSGPLAMNCSTSSITDNVAEPTLVNCQQQKSVRNGTENTSRAPASFCGPSVENGDSLVKDSLHELSRVCKDDLVPNTLGSEREHKDTDVIDRICGFDAEVASVQEVADAKSSQVVGAEQSHVIGGGAGSTVSMPIVDILENHKLKAALDTGISSEVLQVGTGPISVLPANGVSMNSPKSSRYHEESTGPSKIEKEEGELSPNGDFEEENYEEDAPKGKNTVESRQNESRNMEDLHRPDTGGENDVEADDEDSDDASQGRGDASRCESAGDECSHEEHEEDEDVEHDADGKAESEGEAEGMADAQFGDMPLSEGLLLSVKPLLRHVPPGSLHGERKQSSKFYGNDDFYVLFRLHQTLYERILEAKTNSTCVGTKWKTSKDACSFNPYARFMSALYNLLDGSVDNSKFEDECRAIIGNQSYVLFTLDKLIYKLVKQLQTVATDDMDAKIFQLYEYEKTRKTGKLIDSVYYDNARFLLHEENIYRLEFECTPSRLSIQLMDNVTEKPDVLAVAVDPNFAAYLHNDFLSTLPSKKEPHGISLQRNKRKYSSLDEHSALSMAMEGVKTFNGLECKISCNSYKVSYVLDTEDFFFRLKKKKRKLFHVESSNHDKVRARVQRFHKFLSNS